jgi:hypothetical protein
VTLSNGDPTAGLDQLLAEIQSRLTDLEEAVGAIVGPIDPPDIADLKVQVSDLAASVELLNAMVAQDVQQGLDGLNNRLGVVETEMADTEDYGERLDSIEANTAEAVSLVHDLETGVANLSTTLGDVAAEAQAADAKAIAAQAQANDAKGAAATAVNAAAAAQTTATSAQGVAASAQSTAAAAKLSAANTATDLTALAARVKKLENPTPPVTGIDPWRNPFSVTSLWNRKVLTVGAKRNDNWGTKPWPSRNAVPYTVQPISGGTSWTITCPQYTVTGRFSSAPNIGGDSDAAMCVVIGNDVHSYWKAVVDGTNHITASLGIRTALDGTGFGPAPGQKAGTRAAGWSLLAGNITGANLGDRVIPHALHGAIPRVALSAQDPGYVPPAIGADSGWQTTYGGTIRMGSRWAILKDVPCPSSNIDCMTVWTCLQNYGVYIGDATSTGFALIMERTSTTDSQANALGGIMAAIVANLVPVTSVV